MRLILQLCLLVLLHFGAEKCAWGKVATSPQTAVRDWVQDTRLGGGRDAPPRQLTSGEAAAWDADIASAGDIHRDDTLTMAGPVVVTFRGAAFLMCSGAPPPFIGSFRTTTLAWVAYGPNVYAYVVQNPWTHWDPEGLESQSERDWQAKATTADKSGSGLKSAHYKLRHFGAALDPFNKDSTLREKCREVGPGIDDAANKVSNSDVPYPAKMMAKFSLGFGGAGAQLNPLMMSAGLTETAGAIKEKGACFVLKSMANSIGHDAINHPEKLIGGMLVAWAGGNAVAHMKAAAAVEHAAVSGIGYQSFSAFKRAHGPAGPGQAWHHIVEQTPANFGAEAIHNTSNLVRLPHGPGQIHNQISGFYSSKQPFTGGQTVRQWLSKQSFGDQASFGRNFMQQFGGTP